MPGLAINGNYGYVTTLKSALNCKFVAMTIKEANQYLSGQLKAIYEDSEAENISDWVIEHITGNMGKHMLK